MAHTPVLLKEVIDFLNPEPGKFIIDGTINGGGHAKEIYNKISPGGTLMGIDWDLEVIKETAEKIKSQESEAILICDNYAHAVSTLIEKKVTADGLLLDLGFSTEQLENSGRGFSFQRDEPLLMTYSRESKPVMQIIKEKKEEELANIIFELGGERRSRKIAKAIKNEREIKTSKQLAETVSRVVSRNYEHGRIHPATRTFQALRIYANDELNNLESILKRIPEILKPNGRAVIISFHSLEDKLVKNYFKNYGQEKIIEILTKKPIEPTREEVKNNPNSRSAKLRAARII